MTKRRKRLEKGIQSLAEQITIHEEKRKNALEESRIELAAYYEKEISSKERDKAKKEFQKDKL